MLTSLASWASLLLLALAVSVDGFGVGITYGIRQIRIPPWSVIIISICSGLVILLAMLVGALLVEWMPPSVAQAVGAVILIAIGMWALVQFRRGRESDVKSHESGTTSDAGSAVQECEDEGDLNPHQANCPRNGGGRHDDFDESNEIHGFGKVDAIQILEYHRTVWALEIKQWGIIIQILRTPSAADMDRSGTIQAGEAFLLGTALSLDAFGAGIGAAMIGFPPFATSMVIAASSGLFLWLGTQTGLRVAGWRWARPLTALPGIILICIGLLKLL